MSNLINGQVFLVNNKLYLVSMAYNDDVITLINLEQSLNYELKSVLREKLESGAEQVLLEDY